MYATTLFRPKRPELAVGLLAVGLLAVSARKLQDNFVPSLLAHRLRSSASHNAATFLTYGSSIIITTAVRLILYILHHSHPLRTVRAGEKCWLT